MPDPSEQLVRSITQQVIAAIARAQSKPNINTPAPIHPPIGTCTGDYSKFPELTGKTSTQRAATVSERPATTSPTQQKPQHAPHSSPLTGIITAKQIDTQPGPTITLATTARLTPLATDRIRERKLTIERILPTTENSNPGTTPTTNQHSPATPTRYLYWVEGHCPTVRQVTTQLRATLRPAPASSAKSLPITLRSIAQQIRNNRAAGSILFVRSAAAAVCYANRCQSLRASVATCGEAVEQAIDIIAANTLIIEYPHHGPSAIRAMTHRFITAPRPKLPNLHRDLSELTTCV